MVAGRHPRPYTLKDFILNTGGQKREGRTLLPWLLVTGSDSPVRDDSSTLIGSNAPCSCTQQGHASKRGQHAQQGHMPAFNSRIILRGHEKQHHATVRRLKAIARGASQTMQRHSLEA